MEQYLNSSPGPSPQQSPQSLVSLEALQQTQRRGSITDPHLHASPPAPPKTVQQPTLAPVKEPKPKRKSRKAAGDGLPASGSRKSKRGHDELSQANVEQQQQQIAQFAIPVPTLEQQPSKGQKRKLSVDPTDDSDPPQPKRKDSGEEHNSKPDEQPHQHPPSHPHPQHPHPHPHPHPEGLPGEWWPGRELNHPPPGMFPGYPPPHMMAYPWPPGMHPEDPRYVPGAMPMPMMEHLQQPQPEADQLNEDPVAPPSPGGSSQKGSKDGASYSRSPELKVTHKLAERKRRMEMKEMFDVLQKALPVDRGMKASKWEILSKAIEYLNSIKASNENLSREVEMLRHELEQRGTPSAYPPGVVFTAGPPPPGYMPSPHQLMHPHMQPPLPGSSLSRPPSNGPPVNGSEGSEERGSG